MQWLKTCPPIKEKKAPRKTPGNSSQSKILDLIIISGLVEHGLKAAKETGKNRVIVRRN
jgi:hypothetical protein